MLIKAILVSLVVWLGFLDKAFTHSFETIPHFV